MTLEPLWDTEVRAAHGSVAAENGNRIMMVKREDYHHILQGELRGRRWDLSQNIIYNIYDLLSKVAPVWLTQIDVIKKKTTKKQLI